METFTLRNATKFVVKCIVHGKTAQLAEDAIINHTRFEEDDKIVDISSHLVGWYVSDKLKPITDGAVDKAADFIVAKRAARKAKKNNTEIAE